MYSINGITFNFSKNLDSFFRNNFGFHEHWRHNFTNRLEISTNLLLREFSSSKFSSLLLLFYSFVPKNRSFTGRHLLNIYFLDLICCYRGFRHFLGLPVRGQRTWTNSKTAFRNNILLRGYKHKSFFSFFGKISSENLKNLINLEYINFVWKLQWEWEWLDFKKKVMKELKKKSFKKLDLLVSDTKVGVVKKKKVNFIGFEPGFSKSFFKN